MAKRPEPDGLGNLLAARPHQAWNLWAFIADMAMFNVAMSFVSSTTVLPSFIGMLTDSTLMVGLASGLTSGAWLLPQIFVASLIARVPRKKPLMVRAAWASRPSMVLLALVTLLFARTLPTLVLIATLFIITVFFVLDAMVSIPWFDIMARAFPHRIRGRIIGIAQIVGGLGGVGAGILVRRILSEDSPLGFPANYALLFGLSGIVFLMGAARGTYVKSKSN